MGYFNPMGFSLSAVLVTLTSRHMLSALALLLLSTHTRDKASQGITGLSQFSFSSGVFCFASCTNKHLWREVLAPNIVKIRWQAKAERKPQSFLCMCFHFSVLCS